MDLQCNVHENWVHFNLLPTNKTLNDSFFLFTFKYIYINSHLGWSTKLKTFFFPTELQIIMFPHLKKYKIQGKNSKEVMFI